MEIRIHYRSAVVCVDFRQKTLQVECVRGVGLQF